MDIEQLYNEIGIELKQAGSVWKAICPFHTEKTPSFTVYDTGKFYCFGCGVYGTYNDCRERLGFSGESHKAVIRLENLASKEEFYIKSQKDKLEKKLLDLLKKKTYNQKKEAWKIFDLIWLKLNFFDGDFTLIDLSLYIKEKFENIIRMLEAG